MNEVYYCSQLEVNDLWIKYAATKKQGFLLTEIELQCCVRFKYTAE